MSDRVKTKDYRITVRLPAELRRRVKDTARLSGKGESDVVRYAIERQFAVEDQAISAYERAKKAGLIGVVRGASRDLSTNPKHMDGFGAR